MPLSNVHLLWAFKAANDKPCPDSEDESWIENEKVTEQESQQFVETCLLPHLLLEPNSTRQLVLSVIPRQRGDLRLLGIAYKINYPSASSSDVVTPTTPAGIPNPTVLSPTSSTPLSVQGKQVRQCYLNEFWFYTEFKTLYRLSSIYFQMFVLQPKKVLRVTKERPTQENKPIEDNRLNVTIVPGAPQLQVWK